MSVFTMRRGIAAKQFNEFLQFAECKLILLSYLSARKPSCSLTLINAEK